MAAPSGRQSGRPACKHGMHKRSMAGKKRGNRRIEPSFTGLGEYPGDELRLCASDRVTRNTPDRPKKRGKSVRRTRSDAHDRKPPTQARKRKQTRKDGPRQRRTWPFRLFRAGVYWGSVLALWAIIAVAGLIGYHALRMPSATTWAVPQRPPSITLISHDGTVFANRGKSGGEALVLKDMSPYIPQAVIAIEDRRFQDHFGVDPIGLARALLANFRAGSTVQGGSTLTQQLAKNLFLSTERTIERKIEELLLALWLEHRFTKDQILEMYLNRVYFGAGAYGVEAASRRYFDKPASQLTLAEAATLAGLLKAPSRLSPIRNPQAAKARADVVLKAMHEVGFIDHDDVEIASHVSPARAKSHWSGSHNYAADVVLEQMRLILGDVNQDLVVETTLDLDLQEQAESALTKALEASGDDLAVSQGAVVALDGNGAIRALIGGRDYAESQFDRAMRARRQPGSAFKPFVYAAALELGHTPQSIRIDAPVRIGNWTPQNHDQTYRGAVTLSQALALSLNTVSAQLVMEVGPAQVVETARRMGIEGDLQANASIALGTSETSLLELTAAYAPFMNGGKRATWHIIRKITTSDGTVVYEDRLSNPPQVLQPGVVAGMNAMLSAVISQGTGRRARLEDRMAAGKTGTTQGFRDALFVGYTADLIAGVWVGNDDATPMRKVTGGGLPAMIWHDFMRQAHHGLEARTLPGLSASSAMTGLQGAQPPPIPPAELSTATTGLDAAFPQTTAIPQPAQRRLDIEEAARGASASGALAAPPRQVPATSIPQARQTAVPALPANNRQGPVPPANVGG